MPTLRIADVDLEYTCTGRGEPLVLIHGLGSSGKDWERQVRAFAERYRVITFDLRGHGASSKPAGPYSIAELAHDTSLLMNGLHAEPAYVVGVSLGGMIALQLTLDRPDLVRRLVIVNSAPAVVPRGLRQHGALLLRRATLELFGLDAMGRVIGKRLFPRPDQVGLRAEFRERWRQNEQVAYRAALEAIVGWSVSDRLSSLRCPTLVVSGDRDYTPVAYKQQYMQLIPNAELAVIADSGHGTPIDQPEAFNVAVLAFLTGSRGGSGAAPAWDPTREMAATTR